jgi:Zeta toxin
VSDIDPRHYLLPEAESQRIFRDEIVPDELARGVPQQQPVVVFVIAPPGAGKTRTTATIKDQLDQRGGAVVVNSDFYKAYHPEYSRLLATDDRNAAPLTSADGRRWTAMAEAHLIAARMDTIIETTARNPDYFVEQVGRYRAAGYRVEAAFLAVPEPLSRLGIVQRYHDQVQQLGQGRFTPQANHDASYQGVMAVAEIVDRDRIVDVATVLRRGNVQLTVNHLDLDGRWHWPNRSIAQSLDTERRRAWTPDEIKAFAGAVGRLAAEMGPEWHEQLRDITSRAVPLTTATPDTSRVAAAAAGFPQSTRDALGTSRLSSLEPGPPRPVAQPGPEHDRDAGR